ncbi:unnamed protein product [Sympodiomycopsis kandeliae]
MTSAEDPTVHLSVLSNFRLIRILDQDPKTRSAILLGSFPVNGEMGGEEEAIILLEKTHFSYEFMSSIGEPLEDLYNLKEGEPESKRLKQSNTFRVLKYIENVESLGQNDIYTWLLGWKRFQNSEADFKINVIRPVTEAHIKKYEKQHKVMIYETPEMYETIVKPWIDDQPASRINWVYNILDGKKEVENVIYRNDDPLNGFIILPDLKWDQKTLESLYLIAIVQDRSIRSIRDLTSDHIPLLQSIADTASKITSEKYNLSSSRNGLRCFIHYQPSYYHLHVHILSSDFITHPGAIVGQAHLLSDVIDLLKAGVDFKNRTLGYALGERHELYQLIKGKLDSIQAD